MRKHIAAAALIAGISVSPALADTSVTFGTDLITSKGSNLEVFSITGPSTTPVKVIASNVGTIQNIFVAVGFIVADGPDYASFYDIATMTLVKTVKK